MSRLGTLGHKLYTGQVSYNIVGNRKKWYMVSAALLLVAISGILIRGLNLGIEFSGGAEFYVPSQSCSIQDVRGALTDAGVETSTVTEIGDSNIRAQTESMPAEQSNQVVDNMAAACGVTADDVSSRDVGPTWGGEITKQALIALGVYMGVNAKGAESIAPALKR